MKTKYHPKQMNAYFLIVAFVFETGSRSAEEFQFSIENPEMRTSLNLIKANTNSIKILTIIIIVLNSH